MSEHVAPGKLFIAGEYATVQPGEPSLLIAVDRCMRVTVADPRLEEPAQVQGRVHSAIYPEPLTWSVDDHGVPQFAHGTSADLVTRTIEVVAELARSRNIHTCPLHLIIESDLTDEFGTKLGLGSSGAVTVALTEALGTAWEMRLSTLERYQLAMLSTLTFSPSASGGDIAASTLGGWVRYTSPNRMWLSGFLEQEGVAACLATEWDGLELRRLPDPQSVVVNVGWTGKPADTDTLVAQRQPDPGAKSKFLTRSRAAVETLTEGILKDTAEIILMGFAEARDALLEYDVETGGGIETPGLFELRNIAEAHGAIAKPSGAGGGDCGIVLSEQHTALQTMFDEWNSENIVPLSVSIYDREDM